MIQKGNKSRIIRKLKELRKKIEEKIEGITDQRIDDVVDYEVNSFENLNILRLYQLYSSNVENLQASFMELLKFN